MSKNSKLKEIRQEAIDSIKALMKKHSLQQINAVDINEGSSPIIDENTCDENLTFTLDRVKLENDSLEFDGSSSCENSTWDEESIPTDALVSINEWLEENEDTIKEIAGEDQVTIRVTADSGRLAEALRKVADEVEACGEDDFNEWEESYFVASVE
jgi:hypothetical protein